jgi:uncharacterized protein (TIGR03435 family)
MRFGAAAITLLLAIATQAQQAVRPKFEITSLKLSAASGKPFIESHAPLIAVKQTTARNLIRMAYLVRDFQVGGGPAWANSDRYDIEVKAEGKSFRGEWPQTSGLILRAILEDRFQLKLHREPKEIPVYALTIDKRGLRMRESKAANCAPFRWYRDPPANRNSPDFCGAIEGGPNLQLNRTLDAFGISIPELAGFLSSNLDRLVIDRTGRSRRYDLHLEWDRNAALQPLASTDAGPSLFAAVEDQLGLKLESSEGSVEVLVIDHIERPRMVAP